MFPLRDDIPSTRFPIMVMLLMIANILVFWVQWNQPAATTDAFTMQHALVPVRDFRLLQTPGYFLVGLKPFFSSMFMHGGLLHILANLWTFWIFGDNVEGRMGPIKFFVFYIACGLAAAFTHVLLNPMSQLPVVGASGAISGVMGAYLFLFPRARLHMFTLLIFYPIFFELPALVFLIFWFLGQLMSGTADLAAQASMGRDVGGIAFFAHIGGFIAGILLLPFFKGAKPARASRARWGR